MAKHREAIGPHVVSSFDEERGQRQWARIEERAFAEPQTGRRRRYGPLLALAALAAAMALLAVLFTAQPDPSVPTREGLSLRTGASEQTILLSDGSTVLVAADSEVKVVRDGSNGQLIELIAGTAVAHVTRNPSRTFEIRCRGARARALGTRFRVTRTPFPPAVEVEVFEGVVGFTMDGTAGEQRIAAGSKVRLALAQPTTQESVATDAGPVANAPPTRPPEPRAATPSRQEEPPASAVEAVPAADELFRKASAAGRANRHTEAERLYLRLLEAHPRDPRAQAAWFELGRLRLDRLGNARGAVGPLQRATRSAGPYRQDALARLVEAYERLGDLPACRAARMQYLREYANGVHRPSVATRCH